MATDHLTRKGSSARTPSRSKTTRKRPTAKADDEASQPDLSAILGDFADARAVIETACRSLENGDDYNEETSALRTGLRMFNAAYDELDLAINRISVSRPSATNDIKPGV